jgi:hypothetical protein
MTTPFNPAAIYAHDDDVARLARLLDWARENGYRIGPVVEVGTVKCQVLDQRQAKLALDLNGPPSADTVEAEYKRAHNLPDDAEM